MEEIKAGSIVSMFNGCTKEQKQTFVSQIVSDCENGLRNPLEVVAALKHLTAIIETLDEKLSPLAVEELDKYGKEVPTIGGVELRLKEFGTKYDYSSCGDPLLQDLDVKKSNLDEKIKARQTLLKSLKEPHNTEVEGEFVTLYPPIKKSTTKVERKIVI